MATITMATADNKADDKADNKGRRIVGQERVRMSNDLVARYTKGESIRMLASSTGRSYGFVHRVLTEARVTLRQRGGNNE